VAMMRGGEINLQGQVKKKKDTNYKKTGNFPISVKSSRFDVLNVRTGNSQ
jgi:hypothetical protein